MARMEARMGTDGATDDTDGHGWARMEPRMEPRMTRMDTDGATDGATDDTDGATDARKGGVILRCLRRCCLGWGRRSRSLF